MRVILSALLLFLAGCNTVEITKLRIDNETVIISSVLEEHFTPKALYALKDIKIYEGFHIDSYVMGVNIWSNMAGFLTFNGWGRKIITTQGSLSESDYLSSIIHEYTHQLDDLDRDGLIEIIDHLQFWNAFLEMRQISDLKSVTDTILYRADKFITNVFGIGPMSEIIAYTASWVALNPEKCTTKMHKVFSKILMCSQKLS